MRKLTLEQIDRRNAKVMIPKWNEVTPEELQDVVITREDGSELPLHNATRADIDWLHESQLRHFERLAKFGVCGGR